MPQMSYALVVACVCLLSLHDRLASAQNFIKTWNPVDAVGDAEEFIAKDPIIGAPFKAFRDSKQDKMDRDLTDVARDNFKRFKSAIERFDVKGVSKLFSSTDISMLPTLIPKWIRDKQSVEDYLTTCFKNLPIIRPITDDTVQSIGDKAYLHSGLYNWELGDKTTKRYVLPARFSYLWRKIGDEWKIVHYHSSVLPSKETGKEYLTNYV